ncbi:MAG: hypothetical protein FWH44_04175 [Methanomassiliicoccaceae archaeon]|nr:hypothetical protein [Methanomassiliicoccaceae archaeon]
MNATEMLNEAFRKAGREYGYESVAAGFSEFREFKIKWRRSCGWAEFEVSDYLKDAPQNVMDGLAETIFSKLSRQTRKDYPKDMMEWVTSDRFVKKKQPVYLTRSRSLTGTGKGEHLDLRESYDRLVDMGLTERDNELVITWTKQPSTKRVGHCSVLMKVIIISSVLDTPEIPAFVSDYVLYHELLHMKKGFDPFGQHHGVDFHALERLYPMRDEAEEWMKRLRLFF